MISPVISGDGFDRYNIWNHSTAVRELYARRARNEEAEMTCAAQAAELLAEIVRPGESILDAGCGAGHFYHSLARRTVELDYYGIDATRSFISIARDSLAAFGVPTDHLQVMRIEDLDGATDHVMCMNVLTYLDNFHRPLERLLRTARRSLILRESLKSVGEYRYVADRYLDDGAELNVHINSYDRDELLAVIEREGFTTRLVTDRRSGGEPELSIGYPHHWQFVVATRR